MVDVLLGTEFQSSPGTNPGKRNGAEFVLRQFGVNCLQPHHPMLQRTPPTSTNHIPKFCFPVMHRFYHIPYHITLYFLLLKPTSSVASLGASSLSKAPSTPSSQPETPFWEERNITNI